MSAASPAASLRADPDTPVRLLAPGRVGYATAWEWQRELGARRAAGELGDVVVLLEHDPVITLGRRADGSDVLADAADRERAGVELVHVDRGGQATYHGPGQLVGYPVLQLVDRRVADYMRALEEVNLRLAASFGLDAHRDDDAPGVWIGDEKLTAVGARVLAERITRHGWATNVTTDLGAFDAIIPCGDADRRPCSLASLGIDVDIDAVRDRTAGLFAGVFDCRLEPASPDELGLAAAARQAG